MTKIKNSCVLITGGASGIGRIMGRMALERGARKLAIWDIDEEKMVVAAAEFASLGSVATYKVDVSDSAAVEAAYARTRSECGDVDILVNCAGIVTGNKTFDRQSVRDIERTMTINSVAPMVLALQALPDMIARDHGHICNIASAAGMISNPKMSVYVASKWAVIGWSDSVRIELRQARSRVRVTTVAPYYINTGMFDGVRSRIFPIPRLRRGRYCARSSATRISAASRGDFISYVSGRVCCPRRGSTPCSAAGSAYSRRWTDSLVARRPKSDSL